MTGRLAAAALALVLAAPVAASPPPLATAERVLLGEALRLADELGEEIWPGWREAPFEVLLVGAEHEYLVNSPRRPEGFAPLGDDELLRGRVLARPRTVPPNLRATFPLLGGPPVVVMGGPEATGLDPAAWIAVLLHEHFHQLQMADPGYYPDVAALDLAGDDDSGQWMLDYPFPYDDPEVGRRFAALGGAIRAALGGEPAAAVGAALDALAEALDPPVERYLAFQLWQEGVARFVEQRTAAVAGERFQPSPALRALPGYRPFAEVAAELRAGILAGLAEPALAERRRVAFYPVGAGLAMLLERAAPGWRAGYLERKFTLGEQLPR